MHCCSASEHACTARTWCLRMHACTAALMHACTARTWCLRMHACVPTVHGCMSKSTKHQQYTCVEAPTVHGCMSKHVHMHCCCLVLPHAPKHCWYNHCWCFYTRRQHHENTTTHMLVLQHTSFTTPVRGSTRRSPQRGHDSGWPAGSKHSGLPSRPGAAP